jgi:glutaredoxin
MRLEKLKLASAILRKTKFGKGAVDKTYEILGLLIAIVACILAIVGGIKYLKDKKAKTTSSFGKTTEILFYSLKDCGHCIKFKEEWNKLIEITKNNKDIHLEQIEATENPGRIQNDNIMYFPTIKINGKEYEGERTATAILRAAGIKN